MRTLTYLAPVAIAALLFTTACRKEDTPPDDTTPEPPVNNPKDVTKANLVGAYLITKVEAVTGGRRSDYTNTWFREYAGDCAKDDVTELKPDKSLVVRDGTITCNESTDDTGTWDLIDAKRLKLDQDTASIEAFDGALLRVVSPIYSTAQSTIIFTYTRQ